MIHMAVDAAITQKSHDMELMACFLGFVHGFKKHGILLKGSIFDGPSDARQVLIDNASGTNGQMTTSEFPICPVGRPTASPLGWSLPWG